VPLFTIDASVYLSANNPREPDHGASRQFLEEVQRVRQPMVAPTLLLPELAAAARRATGDEVLARDFCRAVAGTPELLLVPLDGRLALEVADLAASLALRGSDAVYVTVAARFGSTLVTLDREQRQRAEPACLVRYPAEVLAGE
jgi:predicted nucleic acid-binding protein